MLKSKSLICWNLISKEEATATGLLLLKFYQKARAAHVRKHHRNKPFILQEKKWGKRKKRH